MTSGITGLLSAGGAGLAEALRARLEQRIDALKETVEEKTAQPTPPVQNNTATITGTKSVLAISSDAFGLLHDPKREEEEVPQAREAETTKQDEDTAAVDTGARESTYIIDEHLDIETSRPNIDDTFFKDSYGAITNTFHSATENRDKYWARFGDPVDRVLDRNYKAIIAAYEDYAQAMTTDHGSAFIDEQRIQSTYEMLTVRLAQAYTSHEKYGLHDYAQEVFAKRAEQELGVAVDLQGLYQEYGINENNHDSFEQLLS